MVRLLVPCPCAAARVIFVTSTPPMLTARGRLFSAGFGRLSVALELCSAIGCSCGFAAVLEARGAVLFLGSLVTLMWVVRGAGCSAGVASGIGGLLVASNGNTRLNRRTRTPDERIADVVPSGAGGGLIGVFPFSSGLSVLSTLLT